jgi:hypothetical protein
MPAKLQTCGLPKMDQKLLEGSQQLRNTRAGCASRRTNVYVDLDRDAWKYSGSTMKRWANPNLCDV